MLQKVIFAEDSVERELYGNIKGIVSIPAGLAPEPLLLPPEEIAAYIETLDALIAECTEQETAEVSLLGRLMGEGAEVISRCSR